MDVSTHRLGIMCLQAVMSLCLLHKACCEVVGNRCDVSVCMQRT